LQGDSLVGRTLGQYQILDEIGRGGMGAVYKAWQPALQRYVAIKVLTSRLGDPEVVQRFQREASIAANLSHPNIVTIYDIAQQDNVIFIAMEYVAGRPLSDVISEAGPLPIERLVRILRQVAEALDYAHRLHFVHRDIKPANILVTAEDRAIVTDFGIAKALEGSGATAQLTAAGTILGTPAYMSPEQIQGQPVDYRTDLYSLGVVCFEMLGGRPPFGGTTTAAILYAQVHTVPPSIRNLNPSVSKRVETALERMLAKQPQDRFPTASAFVAALDGDVITRPVTPQFASEANTVTGMANRSAASTPTASTWGKSQATYTAPRKRSKLPLVLIGGIVLVVAVVGGLLAVLLSGQPGPAPAETVVVTPVPEATWTLAPASAPTDAPTATPAGYLGLTRDVAFHSNRDGNYDIFVLDSLTGEVRQLTDDPADDVRPDWSPDGRQIAFQSDRDGNNEIYVMNADGSDVVRLTDDPANDWKPMWSPDGTRILFESDRNKNQDVYVMGVDGGNVARLTDDPARDRAAVWSPDGRQIAFMSDRDTDDGTNEIYVMNLDGSQVRRLTTNAFDDRAPWWSPDGRQIAFTSDRMGNWDIFVISTEGEAVGLVRLTDDPSADLKPTWSPDGTKFLFESDRDGQSQIYVMNADGSDQLRLMHDSAASGHPAWKRNP
jgi:predicted Ser/Thr protein kinase